VIGHVEIRDLASSAALAAQINSDAVAAADSNPADEARLIPASPSATQNAFLVKSSRVQFLSVTQERADETFVNPSTGEAQILHDRPPLVLHATALMPGMAPRPIIVVVNHLHSFIFVFEGHRRRSTTCSSTPPPCGTSAGRHARSAEPGARRPTVGSLTPESGH